MLPLWEYCRVPEKRPFLLKAVLRALAPGFLAQHALEAFKLLADAPSADELQALGQTVLRASVAEAGRKPLLKQVWRALVRLEQDKDFVGCVDVWVEFVARYFSMAEVQVVLDSLRKRLQEERVGAGGAGDRCGQRFEAFQTSLLSILRKVVLETRDVGALLDLPMFSHFMAMFYEKEALRRMSLLLLEAFVARPGQPLTNVNLAYQVAELCKMLHDTVSVFSPPEESAEVARLIATALNRFSLRADPEQALTFLVSTRALLLNIDQCQQMLVSAVLELALYVVRAARFSATRSAFVQACLANAFITIPSLAEPAARMHLSLQAAQVALAGMAFLQVGNNTISRSPYIQHDCPHRVFCRSTCSWTRS